MAKASKSPTGSKLLTVRATPTQAALAADKSPPCEQLPTPPGAAAAAGDPLGTPLASPVASPATTSATHAPAMSGRSQQGRGGVHVGPHAGVDARERRVSLRTRPTSMAPTRASAAICKGDGCWDGGALSKEGKVKRR